MRMIVLAVFDVQSQSFARPIFVASRGVGSRMLADEINRAAQDNVMYMHPEDFRLFELGEFDDQSGLFVCHQLPQLVVDCSSLKTV